MSARLHNIKHAENKMNLNAPGHGEKTCLSCM